MVLLMTSAGRAAECAAAVDEALSEEVVVAESVARAITLLQSENYTAAVLDQHLLEADPHTSEALFDHLGTAVLVQINLAICGIERVVREVRAALQRRLRDRASASRAVTGQLHSELNRTVTALLLTSELALDTPGMAPAVSEKLHLVHDLVERLRGQLESSDTLDNALDVRVR
jgi:hypothetical protein